MKIAILLLLAVLPALNAQSSKAKTEESQKYTYLGTEKLLQKKVPEAEVDFRMGISKDPKNLVPKYNMGNMYYGSENYDEALLRYQQAAKIAKTKPDKHIAYHNLGNSLMKKQEYGLAVEAYKNAIINDPKDEETRYNYALAKELQKKDQQNKNNKDKDDKKKDQQDKDKDDKKKDQNKNDNKKDDKNDKNEENKKKEDKKDGNKPENKDEGDPKKQTKQESPSQLSPQQTENLLNAVDNEERKVQKKINGQQQLKTSPITPEKDW